MLKAFIFQGLLQLFLNQYVVKIDLICGENRPYIVGKTDLYVVK